MFLIISCIWLRHSIVLAIGFTQSKRNLNQISEYGKYVPCHGKDKTINKKTLPLNLLHFWPSYFSFTWFARVFFKNSHTFALCIHPYLNLGDENIELYCYDKEWILDFRCWWLNPISHDQMKIHIWISLKLRDCKLQALRGLIKYILSLGQLTESIYKNLGFGREKTYWLSCHGQDRWLWLWVYILARNIYHICVHIFSIQQVFTNLINSLCHI